MANLPLKFDKQKMIRTLMLGWELPPVISGGLGVACDGILSGLQPIKSVSTTFVMPKLSGAERAHGALLLSAYPSSQKSPNASSYAYNSDQLANTLDYAHHVSRVVEGLQFDLIHAHDWLCVPAALEIRKRFNVPLIVHVHSTEYDRSGPGAVESIIAIERAGFLKADLIIAVSEVTASQISKKYGIDHSKIQVVHNGIDQASISRSCSPIRSRKRLVSFVGRLTYQKGPHYFIKAAKTILDRGFDVQFVMAGNGDMLNSCVSLVKALGMENYFSFPGFLNAEEVYKLLDNSQVFIMPSLFEPFGIVALEAMAAGVPTVISNNSGISEVAKYCERINAWDSDAIAVAAIRLLSDSNYASSQSALAKFDIQNMSWSSVGEKLHFVYKRALCTYVEERKLKDIGISLANTCTELS